MRSRSVPVIRGEGAEEGRGGSETDAVRERERTQEEARDGEK
jgi:hypothetical protein